MKSQVRNWSCPNRIKKFSNSNSLKSPRKISSFRGIKSRMILKEGENEKMLYFFYFDSCFLFICPKANRHRFQRCSGYDKI